MAVRRHSLSLAAAVCAALALISLLLPSGPTYDPYAWLIWGRDLAHLELVTRAGGTSWKPLPALMAAPLQVFGESAPTAWLVIARGAALFAVVMAFRLAWRLAPGSARERALAGTVAAATLALTREWVRRTGVGDAEGLLVALGLLAVDRHMDRRFGWAMAALVLGSLVRIEMAPFALLYGAWYARQSRHVARAALGCAAIPLLWLGGDWLGSGSATTAASQALRRVPGSPGASAHPFGAVFSEAATMVPIGAAVLAVVALALRPGRTAQALAATALAWTTIVAAMATRGFAGLPRFLFMANALEAVVAGVGAAALVRALAGDAPHAAAHRSAAPDVPARRALALAAPVAALAVFALSSGPAARLLPADLAAIDRVADTDTLLARDVQAAGGDRALTRCGRAATPWYTVTAAAWDLDVATSALGRADRARQPIDFARCSATGRKMLTGGRQPYSRHGVQLQQRVESAPGRVRHTATG